MNDDLVSRAGDLFARTGVPWGRVASAVITGSQAYGLASGDGDTDITVVWTETYRDLVTRTAGKGAAMLRTQPEGQRSGPGDIDMQVYTIRHFVDLAANGNPSILVTLFSPPGNVMVGTRFPFDQIVQMTRSRRAGAAFTGYMESQLRRWREGTIGQRVNRPELVEQHGYDSKYAAAAIRLGVQGVEYLTTGTITLPVPEPERSRLLAIRAGEVPETEAYGWAVQVRDELHTAYEQCGLPEHVDRAKLDDWMVAWHQYHDHEVGGCAHRNARPVRTLTGDAAYTYLWCGDCGDKKIP